MTTPKCILLVEDSPTQSQQYAAHLRANNYETIIAEDGFLALNMAERHKPDLIVLDVNLPGLDGFQVCRRLKRDENLASIPVVMLTAADTAIDTLHGIEAGADDYIPKDVFAIENLLSTLQTLITQPATGGG